MATITVKPDFVTTQQVTTNIPPDEGILPQLHAIITQLNDEKGLLQQEILRLQEQVEALIAELKTSKDGLF